MEQLLIQLDSVQKTIEGLEKPVNGKPEEVEAFQQLVQVIKGLYQADSRLDASLELRIRDVVSLLVHPSVKQQYSQLCTLQSQLKQANEQGLFTQQVVTGHRSALVGITSGASVGASVGASDGSPSRLILQHMTLKCSELLDLLQRELDEISHALKPVYERLVAIKAELSLLLSRKNPHAVTARVAELQDELRLIDSQRIDGKYLARDGTLVAGQAAVINALEACFDDAHELEAAREPIAGDNPLRPVYEQLIDIRMHLDRLNTLSSWVVKPNDIVKFQMRLGDIDNLRSDGKFLDSTGAVPQGQAVLHFLLHKCYRLVHKLQSKCEPVDESLMPIYQQMSALHKCLKELKHWDIELTHAELVPYQMKLSAIDKQRINGVFHNADGDTPEGQALLHDLLDECYHLIRSIQLD